MDKPGHTLIVADFCHPYYTGGSARHVYDLATGFEERGVPFRILTRPPQGPYALGERDVRWERWLADGHGVRMPPRDWFNPFAYAPHIRNARILNIHHPVMGLAASAAALAFGKPILYFFHGPLHREYTAKSGKRGCAALIRLGMQRSVLAASARVLVHSEYMRRECCRVNPSAKGKIGMAPPYLDIRRFRPPVPGEKETDRRYFGLPEDSVMALTTRRLTARTGVRELTAGWTEIRRVLGKTVWLAVAGKGELESEIRAAAPEGVRFLGYVPDADLPRLYRAADVYVLPSLDLEGFGYVILEALASGVPPVVSTAAGGGVEFVEKIDPGLLFAMDSPASLAVAIQHARATWPECTTASLRMRAEAYDVSRLVDFYLRLTDELAPA